MYPTDRLSIFM